MTCPSCPAALNGLSLPGVCPGCGLGLPGDLEADADRYRTPDPSELVRKLQRRTIPRADYFT